VAGGEGSTGEKESEEVKLTNKLAVYRFLVKHKNSTCPRDIGLALNIDAKAIKAALHDLKLNRSAVNRPDPNVKGQRLWSEGAVEYDPKIVKRQAVGELMWRFDDLEKCWPVVPVKREYYWRGGA
jgi:hypothetical protein